MTMTVVANHLPTKLKNYFQKLYSDRASPFFHGFTHEMQQAAFQLILFETNKYTDTAKLFQFPPTEDFLERCRAATQMRKNLKPKLKSLSPRM